MPPAEPPPVAVSSASAAVGPVTVGRGVVLTEREASESRRGALRSLAACIVIGSPLDAESAFGQSFQPKSGTAMAPTPSTPATRPAATVPANRRSRRVVDERLVMFRSVMSESPIQGMTRHFRQR